MWGEVIALTKMSIPPYDLTNECDKLSLKLAIRDKTKLFVDNPEHH